MFATILQNASIYGGYLWERNFYYEMQSNMVINLQCSISVSVNYQLHLITTEHMFSILSSKDPSFFLPFLSSL